MAVLEILTYPHPLLKQVSQPVELKSSQAGGVAEEADRILVLDLIETLNSFPGCVGVAAPQTGNMKRIVVIDASRNRKPVTNNGLLVLINPLVVAQEGSVMAREGCLSLPDFTANVVRAEKIKVEYFDGDGSRLQLETDGFEARVVLHEMDHLDGLLFLDRVSSLKTDVFRRKRY
jgi:peptide deformylase